MRFGGSTTASPLAPFPSKGSPVEIPAGLLAHGIHLLSAPSQGCSPQWYPQISFRSQLRGSAGLVPASLLTASGCEATWISSTSQLFVHLTTIAGALQGKFYGDDQSADDPVGGSRFGAFADLVQPRQADYGYEVRPGKLAALLERLEQYPERLEPGRSAGFFAFEQALASSTRPGHPADAARRFRPAVLRNLVRGNVVLGRTQRVRPTAAWWRSWGGVLKGGIIGVDAVCRTGETAAARADRGISGSRVAATFVLQHAGDSGKVDLLLMDRRKPGCLTA